MITDVNALERDAALQMLLAGKLITEQRAKEAEAEGWSLAVLAKYAEEVSRQGGHVGYGVGAGVSWSKEQIHGAVDALVDLGKMPAETAPHAKGWTCFQLRDYVLGQRWAREADLNALIGMGKLLSTPKDKLNEKAPAQEAMPRRVP